MESPFTPEVRKELERPLDNTRLKHRQGGGGMTLNYLAGYDVIATANKLMGFGNWGYNIEMVEPQNVLGDQGEIIGTYYAARIKLTVKDCIPITEEGVCAVQAGRNPKAIIDSHDMARKGAITDALKRAFRCYGDQFGNSLYDKDYDASTGQEQQQQRQQTPTPAQNRPTAPIPARAVNPAPAPQTAPRTPQNIPAPAPVTAAQPILSGTPAPATAYRMEDDENFKVYSDKIRAATSQKELSDLQPVIKKNVVDRSVLVALRAEYDKRESILLDIANAKADRFAGSLR